MTITLVSCQRSFNKAQWDVVEDMNYPPYRKQMVNDVLENQLKAGMSYSEVRDLLGELACNMEKADGGVFVLNYAVDEKWRGIDPVYRSWLEITFSSDSLLTSARLREVDSR